MEPVFTFSPKLRSTTIAYFERRFEVSLSQEMADAYLKALAELVLAFEQEERAGGP